MIKQKTVNIETIRNNLKSQQGDGIFGDIWSGIKKGHQYLQKTKPLSYLRNNTVSQTLLGLTPYKQVVNQGLDFGITHGGYGKPKTKKTKKSKKSKK